MRRRAVGAVVAALVVVPLVLLVAGVPGGAVVASKPPVKLSGKVNNKGTATPTGTAITIKQTDFAFSPTFIKVPAGVSSLNVTITNSGQTQHTFVVPVDKVDLTLNPGDSKTVNVAIPGSGALGFYCRLHKFEGMQGAFFHRPGE